jgi:predicted nucleic acid-binding protein
LPYLVDANVLIRAYAPLDVQHPRYAMLSKQQDEALQAIKQLRQEGEKLYYTKEIREEVRKAAQNSVEEKQGLGLTSEQADMLVRDIEKKKSIENLEAQVEKQFEGKNKLEIEVKRKEIALAEKDAIKKAEQAWKDAYEKAKAAKELTPKEINDWEHAKDDIPHVATAKVHGLKVLTCNVKDFEIHKDLSVVHPRVIVLRLRQEEIKNVVSLPNRYKDLPEYRNTQLYEVELSSGKKPLLAVPPEYKPKVVEKDIAARPEVLSDLKSWQQGDRPIRYPKIDKGPSQGSDEDAKQGLESTRKLEKLASEKELKKFRLTDKETGQSFYITVDGKDPEQKLQELLKNESVRARMTELSKDEKIQVKMETERQPIQKPPEPPLQQQQNQTHKKSL